MSKSGNFGLFNSNRATDRTLLTIGHTSFGTGCRCTGNSFLGVAESRNCFGLGVTGCSRRTYCTSKCLFTSSRTGGRCGNFFLITVAKSGNNFLFNNNSITYRTMLTFGKTGCSTGRCYCRINNLGVAESGNNFLFNNNSITYRTMLTLGKTGCGTCGSYCRINNLGVAGRLDNSAADGTGLCGGTGCSCAGGVRF